MTEHVRKSYRNHRKTTWGATLVVLVLTALVIALPALAEQTTSPGNGLPPASGQNVYPSLANVGGTNFSCASAGATVYPSATPTPSGMRQFQISNPKTGTYTDPATGVKFVLSPPGQNKDPKAFFSFAVEGGAAVVYHLGINGGTKTSWYDYVNNTPLNSAVAGDGVIADTNVHAPPDTRNTFYAASHTTFCYQTLTVQPSCDEPFPGIAFGGTAGTVEYSAQLEPNAAGQCKDQNVVMFSFVPGTDRVFAQLSPIGSGEDYEVVEHIEWSGITTDTQNPVTLWYDDVPPYGDDRTVNLPLCNSDPRDPATPFELPGSAPHAGLLPGTHTSCMLESTDSAGTEANNRAYEAWIFSTVDGGRGMG
jgi:hypothetical protein